jgi:hypothetical protein
VFTPKVAFNYALSSLGFKDMTMALSKFSRKLLSERLSLKLKNRRKVNGFMSLVNKDLLLESSDISIGMQEFILVSSKII